MLPKVPYESGTARIAALRFGGLDRRDAAGAAVVTDMENLCGDGLPALSSRPKRLTLWALTAPAGVFGTADALFYVDAGRLCRNGSPYAGTLPAPAGTMRQFACMGERLLLWPDKRCYDTKKALDAADAQSALEASVTASCTFADGTYGGVAAAGNTLLGPAGLDWSAHFRVGDGVTISGAADAGNNKTAVVREIAGNALRFYENTFTVSAAAASVTVARTVPDLDYICVCDNRLWGCKGDTIRCCKLGDPGNWNVFDGVSTDAWSVETGTPGAFTGCVSFMGYPIFFKEDRVFKVYGNKPANFEVMASAALGVLPGAERTLAVAGETLYYLSRAGFVRYNGGYPTRVDEALSARYTSGAAGSDGRRYYVSAQRADGTREFLAYDGARGVWHREDALNAAALAYGAGRLAAQTAAALLSVGPMPADAGSASPEADFESAATLGPFDGVRFTRGGSVFAAKYPVRLWLRYALAPFAEGGTPPTLTVLLSYDGGEFETAAVLPAGGRQARSAAVPVRRCDGFRVRLTADGAWKLYALELELRAERKNRKEG